MFSAAGALSQTLRAVPQLTHRAAKEFALYARRDAVGAQGVRPQGGDREVVNLGQTSHVGSAIDLPRQATLAAEGAGPSVEDGAGAIGATGSSGGRAGSFAVGLPATFSRARSA